MFRRHTIRSPRTSGSLKMKRVFQIAFMIVVGIWLIYQASQSQIKNSDFAEDDKGKIRKLIFSGRNENVRESEINIKGFEGVVEKDDSESEDDELDGHSEEKAKGEATKEEGVDLEEKALDDGEREAETEQKNQTDGDGQSSVDGQMKSGGEGDVLHKDKHEEEEAGQEKESHDKDDKGEKLNMEMEGSDKDNKGGNEISDQSEKSNDISDTTKEGDDLEEKASNDREREAETEPKNQPERDEQSNVDGQMKSGSEGEVLHEDNHEEEGAEKKEIQDKKEKGEETDTEMEASDKDSRGENGISVQSEETNEALDFTDENGIPNEDHDSTVSSRDTETKATDAEASSDQVTISDLDMQTIHGETVVSVSSNSSAAGKQNEKPGDKQSFETVEMGTQEGKGASKEETTGNDNPIRDMGVNEEIHQTSETAEGDDTDSTPSPILKKAKRKNQI